PLRSPHPAVDGPHAVEGSTTPLPAPRRGRTFLPVSTAAVALAAGSMLAAAQQSQAGAAAAAETAAPAKKAPAKAPAKEAAAKTGSPSYSLGVAMGEEVR